MPMPWDEALINGAARAACENCRFTTWRLTTGSRGPRAKRSITTICSCSVRAATARRVRAHRRNYWRGSASLVCSPPDQAVRRGPRTPTIGIGCQTTERRVDAARAFRLDIRHARDGSRGGGRTNPALANRFARRYGAARRSRSPGADPGSESTGSHRGASTACWAQSTSGAGVRRRRI